MTIALPSYQLDQLEEETLGRSGNNVFGSVNELLRMALPPSAVQIGIDLAEKFADASESSDVHAWLNRLYELVEGERIDDALDYTIQTVDGCFRAGEFALVDSYLRQIDAHRLDTNLIVGWFAFTKPAKASLEEREAFVARAEAHLDRIAPHRVEELIGGLR